MEDSKDKNANTFKSILNNTENKFLIINNLIKGKLLNIEKEYKVKSGRMK